MSRRKEIEQTKKIQNKFFIVTKSFTPVEIFIF